MWRSVSSTERWRKAEQLAVDLAGAREELRPLEEAAAREARTLDGLRDQLGGAGGRKIQDLEQNILDLEKQKGDRLTKRDKVEAACKALDWPVPADGAWMATRASEAKAMLDAGSSNRQQHINDQFDLRQQLQEKGLRFGEVRQEVAAMEANPSNIPSHLLAIRANLARALRVAEDKLPFAGELIEVRPEDAKWQGAIERVLGGFATSILIDDRHYHEASRWIDEERLNARIFYNRIQPGGQIAGNQAIAANSLVRKLQFAKTAHADWVREELKSRFDYECVDDLAKFREARRSAVTLKGQVKHSLVRHEKNDRFDINDRKRWVLGLDNRAKLEVYREEGAELGMAIAGLQTKMQEAVDVEDSRPVEMAWIDQEQVERMSQLPDVSLLEQQGVEHDAIARREWGRRLIKAGLPAANRTAENVSDVYAKALSALPRLSGVVVNGFKNAPTAQIIQPRSDSDHGSFPCLLRLKNRFVRRICG